MATLSKQGYETERFDLLRKSYSVRSNGHVLKNEGFGWKMVTLKPGVTAGQFAEDLRAKQSRQVLDRPSFCAYKEAVLREFALSVRWRYLTAVDLLGADTDGIWSELSNRGVDCDLDTLCEFETLRQAALHEKYGLRWVNTEYNFA